MQVINHRETQIAFIKTIQVTIDGEVFFYWKQDSQIHLLK